MKALIVSCIAFFAVAAQAAYADNCRPAVLGVRSNIIQVRYDPFANTDLAIPVIIDADSGDCANRQVRFDIVAEDQTLVVSSGAYTLAPGLRVDFVDQSGRSFSGFASLGDMGRSSNSGRVPISDAFRVSLRRGQAVAPGSYATRFYLRTLGPNGDVVDMRPFTLALDVLPSVRVSAEARVIDLGSIHAGEQQSLDINTFANVDYRITVQSERGWRLRQNGGAGTGIPYSLSVGNQALSPTGDSASIDMSPSASGYRALQLGVHVNAFDDQPAGTYRDYITIQVTPAAL